MEPFVLRGFLIEQKWPPIQLWSDEEYLSKNLGRGKRPRVRIGPRQKPMGEILHDHKSECHEFASIEEMLDWMKNNWKSQQIGLGKCRALPSTHWAYLDYHDILELLEEEEAAKVDWARLGVIQEKEENMENDEAGASWHDSTVWIGTPGAYTPCHFDTYGFNLHAQIRGYKRWLLFPPETPLRPTRLPYEESSVFSALDVLGGPRTDKRLAEIVPRAVTMGPGDLLFVPPKWWHSVQCVEGPFNNEKNGRISISVNKWFPVEEDVRESAKEAILKFIMAVCSNCPDGALNLKEHICLSEQSSIAEGDLNELAEFVQFRLDGVGRGHCGAEKRNEQNGPSEAKRPKKAGEVEKLNHQNRPSPLNFFYDNFSGHPLAEPVPAVKWKELKLEEGTEEEKKEEEEEGKLPANTLKMQLLEAIGNSAVLDSILEAMMNGRRGTDL